jgi:hypothetical protein
MTLTLELSQEQEARLNRQAGLAGIDVRLYAHTLIERSLETDLDNLTTGYEQLPVLTPEATTRAQIYGRRG